LIEFRQLELVRPDTCCIVQLADYYNTERYHESLNNLTPEDVYTGRGQTVLNRRKKIKQQTIEQRRRLYYRQKAA